MFVFASFSPLAISSSVLHIGFIYILHKNVFTFFGHVSLFQRQSVHECENLLCGKLAMTQRNKFE